MTSIIFLFGSLDELKEKKNHLYPRLAANQWAERGGVRKGGHEDPAE